MFKHMVEQLSQELGTERKRMIGTKINCSDANMVMSSVSGYNKKFV
jgi:hypothetical protein